MWINQSQKTFIMNNICLNINYLGSKGEMTFSPNFVFSCFKNAFQKQHETPLNVAAFGVFKTFRQIFRGGGVKKDFTFPTINRWLRFVCARAKF